MMSRMTSLSFLSYVNTELSNAKLHEGEKENRIDLGFILLLLNGMTFVLCGDMLNK